MMAAKTAVRVRIAPSPTGSLHIGTARTALFNWLFAKQHGGSFILRIEDTDRTRSTKAFETDILKQLHWLGLDWNEGPEIATNQYRGEYGPYRQSERSELYKQYLQKLLDTKRAYHCFCTKEELEDARQGQLADGLAPKYRGTCRILTAEDIRLKFDAGLPSVIRFKTPEEKVTFKDVIRGEITTDLGLVGDFVIAKTLAEPLYNFCVVVDDALMQISHVIRGEEHIANTPRQLAIQRALNLPAVTYAHLPLILNADRSKMSKREQATSLESYRRDGYLPKALINFLVLLGWHPLPEEDPTTGKLREREIFSNEDLIERFDMTRIQKGGAMFNPDKLDWINSQYIKELSSQDLFAAIKAAEATTLQLDDATFQRAFLLVRERVKKLSDIPDLIDFIFKLPEYPASRLIWKKTTREATLQNLTAVRERLVPPVETDLASDEAAALVMPLAEERGRGEVLWPLRVALSGKENSPGPFEIMAVLGAQESVRRIDAAIEKLSDTQQNTLL